MVVQVEKLVKSYNGLNAIDSIDFSIKNGEFFGFIGPNGAGKTTTINILCTLLRQTSGIARVNNYDCLREASKVRSSIGLVFQDTTLDVELTAYENLVFHCYLYNMRKSVFTERIKKLLKIVDLDGRKDEVVKNFSGGMKRRLEIARGLLHYPKVLFLDEPTLGLDPQTRLLLWEFIGNLRNEEEITIFLTTHYLEEAEQCGRIAVIDNGKIIAEGSPYELKQIVKGDVIILKTSNNDKVEKEILEKFNISPLVSSEILKYKVESAEEFLPRLLSSITSQIKSINIEKPSLNEVFLHLTGRELRDEPPAKNGFNHGIFRKR